MILNVKDYRAALKEARKSGLSTDMGELDGGIMAMGAPVFNRNGEPVAAVVIVGLESRANHHSTAHYASELKKTAGIITAALSCESNLL
jgi:DNA-binding IclR family transcriptional regulator